MIQHFDVDASLQCLDVVYFDTMESKHRHSMKAKMLQTLLWRELWPKQNETPFFEKAMKTL